MAPLPPLCCCCCCHWLCFSGWPGRQPVMQLAAIRRSEREPPAWARNHARSFSHCLSGAAMGPQVGRGLCCFHLLLMAYDVPIVFFLSSRNHILMQMNAYSCSFLPIYTRVYYILVFLYEFDDFFSRFLSSKPDGGFCRPVWSGPGPRLHRGGAQGREAEEPDPKMSSWAWPEGSQESHAHSAGLLSTLAQMIMIKPV